MDIRFLVALSAISIVSGAAVVACIAAAYYSLPCGCPVLAVGAQARPCCEDPSAFPLIVEGSLLVLMGAVVLLNRHRIEKIQARALAAQRRRRAA